MLPTDIAWPPDKPDIPVEALQLIMDPNWCAQTKEDGNHVLAARTPERVTTRNRNGTPHPVTQAVGLQLAKLPANSMLDGEKLHTGSYVVFDLLYLDSMDFRGVSYKQRFELAEEVCTDVIQSPLIRPVRTAWTTEDKFEFVRELRQANAEGVIFRDWRAPYIAGRPAFGGPLRRLKFIKSLTCLVQRRIETDRKAATASFDMFLYSPSGQIINIGEVSSSKYHNQLTPGEMRVAEIIYLYSTPEGKLTQPRLRRPVPWRTDKVAGDCTIDQLVLGGRFAVKG
jgi:ATP-dependent DNA ligase